MATSEARHTPTPWRAVIDQGNPRVFKHAMALVATTAEGAHVQAIDCTRSGANFVEDRANAEFIVRAVNCHEELVAALKVLLASANYSTDAMDAAEAQARAALSKASGQQKQGEG